MTQKTWLERKWHRFIQWWLHLWQRCTRGYDDSVTWSLNTHLASVIAPRIKLYRKLNSESEYGGMPVRRSDKTEGEPDCYTMDEWNAILDEMVWAFEFSQKDWYADNYFDSDPEYTKTGVINKEKFNFHEEKWKADFERYQRGLKLFAEHFDDLWW